MKSVFFILLSTTEIIIIVVLLLLLLLLLVVIVVVVVVVVVVVITFMQCIYNHMPESSHVSRGYYVAALMQLQFVVYVILFPLLNVLFCYSSTFKVWCHAQYGCYYYYLFIYLKF